MRKTKVNYLDRTAVLLLQDEEEYHFLYDQAYLESENPKPVSLTLPLQAEKYSSKTMFPFFDSLIPEGWMLDVAEWNWKINSRDRMGLLMNCCADCIGAVSVHPIVWE